MPDTTPFLSWPIPARGADPFYDAFVALMNAIDATAYGPAREDRNLVLFGGGTVAFSGDSLSWSSALSILAAQAGRRWIVAAATVTILDGQMLVVELVRSPQGDVTLAPAVVSVLARDTADNALVLAVRRSGVIYWRNGKIVASGASGPLFEVAGMTALEVQAGGTPVASRTRLNFIGATVADNPTQARVDVAVPRLGATGQRLISEVVLTVGRDTDSTGYVIAGHRKFNLADFALDGAAADVQLIGCGYVTVPGVTGQVELASLDSAFTAVTLSWSGLTSPTEVTSNVSLPAGSNRYRVRVRATGSTGPAERFYLDTLVLRVRLTLT